MKKTKIPVRILQWLSLIPFAITVYGVFNITAFQSEIFKWFVLGVGLLASEYVFNQFKRIRKIRIMGTDISLGQIEDDEISLTNLSAITTGRRFSNLIYIIAKDTKRVALAHQGDYNKYLPPGKRLDILELPHESLIGIIETQIGLEVKEEQFINHFDITSTPVYDDKGAPIGSTEVCISPQWIQLEKHEHIPDKDKRVSAHFDFVYLCLIEKEVPFGPSVRKDPGWFSIDEVGDMINIGKGKRTFPDVYYGLKRIFKYHNLNPTMD